MALIDIEPRRSNNDLENAKFGLTSSNKVAVRIDDQSSLLSGIEYDAILASYPNSTTEVYVYKTGGLAGVTKATITVIYTDSNKNFVLSVVRT